MIVEASVEFKVSPAKVWDLLINPEMTKQYMFGCEVESDWEIGSPVLWKGRSENGEEIVFVKGDVLDIGKNIVAVVLACNGYEVIDLGVMVSCEEIVKKAKEHDASIIGMSGLITPSLDEMIHNVKEFKRLGFDVPVMIGGATTSKAHTAIKVAEHYDGAIAQVGDASLVVEICSKLLNPDTRDQYTKELKEKQKAIKERFESGDSAKTKLVDLSTARDWKNITDWETVEIAKPSFIGKKVFNDISLEDILPYIDWSPFFWTWQLKGTYPKILNNEKYGEHATSLFNDANDLLKTIIKEKKFNAKAVVSIWKANSVGDDVEIYDEKNSHIDTFRFLRQQKEKTEHNPHMCLSDFIAPKDSERSDYLGGFAVTMSRDVEDYADSFKDQGDDYSSILIKALGDRFAEALAEYMHKEIRDAFEYGKNESLSNEDLIKEKYRGIRPAAGYPACPDHTEKGTLWNVLDVEKEIGLTLTENFAMNPASSVSGLYFTHPKSKYFTLGPIGKDQVKDYAKRKEMSVEKAEKWLAPNLGYNPEG